MVDVSRRSIARKSKVNRREVHDATLNHVTLHPCRDTYGGDYGKASDLHHDPGGLGRLSLLHLSSAHIF